MTRITPWFFHARDAVILLLGIFSVSCLTPITREEPPPLVISPQSAIKGDVLPLTLTAEGMDLKTCVNNPKALKFKGPSEQAVLVHRIDDLLYEQSGSRAFITISENAVDGEYEVSYACNDNTMLTGGFRIDKPADEMVLNLNKTSLAAGAFSEEITFTASDPFFTEETDLLFGSGDVVKVTQKRLLEDAPADALLVVVDISPSAPLGDMVVTAKTAGRVARGILTITDRIKTSISVSPSEVYRQAAEEFTDVRKEEITITGEGIEFVVPDEEAGIPAEAATKISFPENPYITVSENAFLIEIEVDGEMQMAYKTDILIEKAAPLGGTELLLQTGDREAWTTMTVLLPPGSAYLKVVGSTTVSRSEEGTRVFAQAVNCSLDKPTNIECATNLCQVTDTNIDTTQKKIDFSVVIDKAFEGNQVEVTLLCGEVPVGVDLMVESTEIASLLLEDSSKVLQQGKTAPVRFMVSGVDFEYSADDVMPEVLPRSGLKISESQYGNDDLLVVFDVASDAPVGPAYLKVTIKDLVLETPITIVPAAGMPVISCTPGATLRKRELVTFEVTGNGMTMPDAISGYAFDDPGLRITDVRLNDLGAAIIDVDVSPRARTDMAVLYVKGEEGQAATTFRVLDYPQPEVLTADPAVVNRSDRTVTIAVTGDEETYFESKVVEVADNVDGEVTKTSPGQNLVFNLQLDSPGDGGFTGLVIRDNGRTYLSHIQIQSGKDNSLTASVSPDTVYPGYVPQTISVVLPVGMSIDNGIPGVYTGLENTFASYPVIDETVERKLVFNVDVPFDVMSQGQTEIPIFVTSAPGAAVGFLNIAEVETINLQEGKPFDDSISAGPSTLFQVLPNNGPMVVHVAFNHGAGDGTAALIAENQLDAAEPVRNHRLWILDNSPRLLAVTADAEDNPVQIEVKSRGKNVVLENTEDTEESWSMDASPCEKPLLGLGTIDGALDADMISIGDVECDLVVAVHARNLANRPWETPDLWIEAQNKLGSIAESSGFPTITDSDPVIALFAGETGVDVNLRAELGSAGTYMVNVRRPHLIRELARGDGAFVELLIGPSDDINALSLSLIDINSNPEAEVARLELADADIREGIWVVSAEALPGADFVHEVARLPSAQEGGFALVLSQNETIIDAVQIGTGIAQFGEGSPIIGAPEQSVFFRVDDMDTNDNSADFMAGFVVTPGY